MKKIVILFLVFSGIFLPVQLANANVLMQSEDVSSMQINRTSGGTCTFNENEGIEEFVIRNVVEWINTASPVIEATELVKKNSDFLIKNKNEKR